MQRTQISLTSEERSLLDAEAARTGRSISALIRDAVTIVYSPARDDAADRRAIQTALGAWEPRTAEGAEIDGAEYVDRLRSGRRLDGTAAR